MREEKPSIWLEPRQEDQKGKRLPPALQSRGQNPVLKGSCRRCDKFKTPQSGSRQHLESLDIPVFLEFDKRALFTPVTTRASANTETSVPRLNSCPGGYCVVPRPPFGRKDSQAGFIGKDCESFGKGWFDAPHGKNAAQGKTRGQGREQGFGRVPFPRNLPCFGFGQSNDRFS